METTNLTADSEEEKHEEEKSGPQLRERHQTEGTGIHNKCQTRTCKREQNYWQ
jgi:hypothetical protein